MNIPMPTAQEKARSIEYIKANSIKKNKNVFSVVKEMYCTFGFRNMFFGFADCIYISLMCFGTAAVLWLTLSPRYTFISTVTASPLLYVTAYLISIWKESIFNTLPVQKACKYTPAYMTAFRMLFLSVLSIAADIPVVIAACTVTRTDFFKLLLVAFCSLFAYSVISVSLLIYVSRRWVQSVLPIIWTAVMLFTVIAFSDKSELFLSSLSGTLLFAICAFLAVIYVLLLNRFIKKGEKEYAYR